MPRRALLAALATVLALTGVVFTPAAPAAAERGRISVVAGPSKAHPNRNVTEYNNRVVHIINVERARRGLRPVRHYNSCLTGYAHRWARRLAATETFKHQAVGVPLRRCDVSWIGENLGRGTMTPRALVSAWLRSPSHRAIVLKARATRAGLGTTYAASGRRYTVLLLADHT